MEHDFPWLPIGTEIIEGAKAGKLLGNGNGYQLIAAKDDDRVILLINKSADLLNISGLYKKRIGDVNDRPFNRK